MIRESKEPAKPPQTHLVFSCGESWYAVPSERAAEIVTFPELTRVPGGPHHLLGVFAHRGEVIPVIDLASLAGKAPLSTRRAVLIRLDRGSLALTASRVSGVSAVDGALAPLGSTGLLLHLRGPGRSANNEVSVIEPEGLFDYLSQAS